ncbi:MAG: PQQ-binding-like beta-propeller repeat protein [Planctomycetaceae bacterium]
MRLDRRDWLWQLLAAGGGLIWTTLATAADDQPPAWNQFRGSGGMGQADGTNPPTTWSEGENVAWKVPIPGKGWSSPVVQGNSVWLTTATQAGRSLRVVCLDADSGKLRFLSPELFAVDPGAKGLAKAGQAAPTPVVTAHHVYAHFGAFGTACLNHEGELLWSRVIPYYHHHGPGSSPALVDDVLVVVCDGFTGPFFDKLERAGVDTPQFVLGLDALTGEIRWKAPREGKHSYATPLVIDVDGELQVVCPGGDGVWAYNPQTGEELWRYQFVGHSVVPRPVWVEGRLLVCTGYHEASLLALDPRELSADREPKLLWKLSKGVPFVPSPVVVDDLVYLVTDEGILSAVETATGKLKWKQRLGGMFSASPVASGKRIYATSESGTTHVWRAGAAFRRLAENILPGQVLASPAVVGDRLYLRTETHLYCLAADSADASSPKVPVQLTSEEVESSRRR